MILKYFFRCSIKQKESELKKNSTDNEAICSSRKFSKNSCEPIIYGSPIRPNMKNMLMENLRGTYSEKKGQVKTLSDWKVIFVHFLILLTIFCILYGNSSQNQVSYCQKLWKAPLLRKKQAARTHVSWNRVTFSSSFLNLVIFSI